jgi:hypothetical protein
VKLTTFTIVSVDGVMQVHGSGSLVRWLFDNQLVDEITLLTSRWSSARARGCSPDTGPDIALDPIQQADAGRACRGAQEATNRGRFVRCLHLAWGSAWA